MSLFAINFDGVAYTSSPGPDPIAGEFGPADLAELGIALPAGVVEVRGGGYSPDDSVYTDGRDEDGVKLFVAVSLLVEASDLKAAESFEPPAEFLKLVGERLGGALNFDFEDEWDHMDAAEVTSVVVGDEGYWSNAWGWTELEGATRFTDEETTLLHLPMGGRWMRLSEIVPPPAP